MEPLTLIASGAAVAALGLVTRQLRERFDQLVSKEREQFEIRFGPTESTSEASLGALLSEIRSAEGSALREEGGLHVDDGRLQQLNDLEIRLATIEADQEASQREFAVQREYHSLGLAQSKISFTLGYVFGALGAIVLLAGAVKILFFSDTSNQATAAFFTVIAGAIPEALAGLLFVSASRAGARMTENFDRGRADRDLAAAQKIAGDMEDRALGNRLQAILALSMARASVDESALRLVQMSDGGLTHEPSDGRVASPADLHGSG